MKVWIDFTMQSGAIHPEAAHLKKSEFALFIESCIREYPNVFGENRPVNVWLSANGKTGELLLSYEFGGEWIPNAKLSVSLSMLHESPLSESLKNYIRQFIDSCASSQIKKN